MISKTSSRVKCLTICNSNIEGYDYMLDCSYPVMNVFSGIVSYETITAYIKAPNRRWMFFRLAKLHQLLENRKSKKVGVFCTISYVKGEDTVLNKHVSRTCKVFKLRLSK